MEAMEAAIGMEAMETPKAVEATETPKAVEAAKTEMETAKAVETAEATTVETAKPTTVETAEPAAVGETKCRGGTAQAQPDTKHGRREERIKAFQQSSRSQTAFSRRKAIGQTRGVRAAWRLATRTGPRGGNCIANWQGSAVLSAIAI